MALTWEEIESVTDDYFILDGGQATDIYFEDSFLLNYLLKQHKGIWERPTGGERIRVPVEYYRQKGGFYSKGETLDSDDSESLNAAYFDWKHAYGNATIYRIDMLKNESSDYGHVQLVEQRVSGAQKSITEDLAGSIYDLPGGSSKRLTGLRACCNETTSVSYGDIAEDDMAKWEGKMSASSLSISPALIRTAATAAKVRDGKKGRPDLVVTTETLWNRIADILQAQQRFTDGKETVKAGFTGLHFEGKDIFPDDYCPASHMFVLNSNFIGFAVHANKGSYFGRTPWMVIEASPMDKTLKILLDGNMVASNRKAHQGYSALS